MVDDSEQRQRQELALRLTQLNRDVRHAAARGLVRTSTSVSAPCSGRTFKTEAGQQEMMNLLRRVAAQPIP